MNKPILQARGQDRLEETARQENLWEKAPAWRGLVVAASLLTLAAVAVPVMLPAQTIIASTPAHAIRPAVASALPAHVQAPPAQEQQDAAPPPRRRARVHTAALAPRAQADAQTPANICALRPMATGPRLIGLGTVAGFEDHALSLARIQVTEANVGGKIDPGYIDNQRIIVQRPNGQARVFILPKGLTVAVGDRVTLQDGYRNMALPCNYIPIEIASDIGPAPAAAQTDPTPPQN